MMEGLAQVAGAPVSWDVPEDAYRWSCPTCPVVLWSGELADAAEYAIEHVDAYHPASAPPRPSDGRLF